MPAPRLRASKPLFAGLTLVFVSAGLLGCSNSRPVVKPEIAAYRAGAHDRALAMSKSRASRDPESRLIAGMSAHALGKNDEARIWLGSLTADSRADIRSRAQATMGLIELQNGRESEARHLLETAAPSLSPSDARQARAIASGLTSYPARSTTRTSGPWTIQVGAFNSSSNATEQANRVRAVAAQAGLGKPTITQQRDGARSFYTVGFGSFPTEDDAQRTLDRLGVVGIVKRRG